MYASSAGRGGWVSQQEACAGWDRAKLAHLSSLGCRPPVELLLLLLVGLQVVLGSLLLGKAALTFMPRLKTHAQVMR